MHNLLYIGSPQFDGVGILNIEAQKLRKHGDLTILDGVILNAYPEIKNFGRLDYLVWNLIRKKQFFGALGSESFTYLQIGELVKGKQGKESPMVEQILEQAILDHCVCNGINGDFISAYRARHWEGYYSFLCVAYQAILDLLQCNGFSKITIFNGRNTLSRLLVAAAKEQGVSVQWIEYFGKRQNKMTYVTSPVDIFDLDALSSHIHALYCESDDSNKAAIAEECLSDRVRNGDPLLVKWGVDFSQKGCAERRSDKLLAAFFFSSEDEYPAFKPSIYGLKPPSEQYNAFVQICERVLELGLHEKYKFLIKLHPRYAFEKEKLDHAQGLWRLALDRARELGIDFEVLPPLASAYRIIEEVDIVFSYGSTAWEATYLGRPAVLLGPNAFATHNCVYIANAIHDVVAYLRDIPQPLPRENCYPYAWAWREWGQDSPVFVPNKHRFLPQRIANVLFNRFSLLDHASQAQK